MRYWVYLSVLAIPIMVNGQIEESAEVFLEAYTDEFQEHFFEGLKQQGIENYDRAIEAFLKCKDLDPSNPVVDHELAKSYALDKKAVRASEYALAAIISEPDNRWYLNTYIQLALKQGYQLGQIKTVIPYDNIALKTNLAHILFLEKRYEEALEVLGELQENQFVSQLRAKATDSLSEKNRGRAKEPKPEEVVQSNPLDELRIKMNDLVDTKQFGGLEQLALSATESYPSQPDFYYYHGLALRNLKEYQRAVRSLETALDYLLDDRELANNIYRQLAGTYMDMGNSSKANTYLSKIKTGL